MSEKKEKTVNSNVVSLKTLLEEKFQVKYYQRDYVWQTPQISDLISDLATEFLKIGSLETNWMMLDPTPPILWGKLFYQQSQAREVQS